MSMEAWIKDFLNSGNSGFIVMLAVFLLGSFAVVTCACNYALFAVVAGYSGSLSGEEKSKQAVPAGIAFLLGAVISMAIMGSLFGYAGHLMSAASGTWWRMVTGSICIVFGLWSMDMLPFKLPSVRVGQKQPKPGLVPAIIFGLTVGGISTAFNSCCNPVFPVVLAASFINGSIVWGLTLLTVFALGYALPLAIGFTGIRWGLGRLSGRAVKITRLIPFLGGVLLIIMGFYFLLTI